MKEKTLYSSRKWLNTDKSKTSFVSTNVEKVIWDLPKGRTSDIWGSAKIADCDRVITLECDVRGSNRKKDAKATFRKIDTLIDELQNLRDAIEQELEKEE